MIRMILAAALVLSAAVYTQYRIPRFTASARAALLMRAGLVVLGLVFGYTAARNFGDAGVPPVMTFLIAFGAVHVPAAFILFFKGAAGAGKS